jgi:nitrogen regulatory protein P-II 2
MQLYRLKLVTVVTELVLQEQLVRKVLELGATGCTYREASGDGSRGARHDAGGENVQVEVVCSPEVAEDILTFVSHHYFENYACIAWVTDVEVVRGSRYVSAPLSA